MRLLSWHREGINAGHSDRPGPAREHEPATIRATGGVSQGDAAAASEEAD